MIWNRNQLELVEAPKHIITDYLVLVEIEADFVLKITLTDNVGMICYICKMDEDENLTKVVETEKIVKTANRAKVKGVIIDTYTWLSLICGD